MALVIKLSAPTSVIGSIRNRRCLLVLKVCLNMEEIDLQNWSLAGYVKNPINYNAVQNKIIVILSSSDVKELLAVCVNILVQSQPSLSYKGGQN
jgi:hypothetical protein